MIGGAIQAFYNFWSNNRKLFFTLLLTICSILIYGLLQLRVSQDIYSILPEGKSFEKFNTFLSNNSIGNKVFFLVDIESSVDEGEIRELLSTTKDSINKHCESYLDEIVLYKDGIEESVYNYYYDKFPLLIDSGYYDFISKKIERTSIENSIQATYRTIVSPGGGILKKYVLNDPVFITEQFFKNIERAHTNSKITLDDGIMYSEDKNSAFMYASLKNNVTIENEKLYKALSGFKESWNNTHPEHKFDFFGSFQIAAENSLQVKKDTQVTLTITISIIILILFLYYRKITIPLFFILPAIFGGLFALGIIGYLHPEVSGLSLATGAILFGIVLDYSFHFFTHLKHTKSLEDTTSEIAIPLLTGSLTTILAFSALMFANSVILQDFGLFATLTLVGASLFTLFILPVILNVCSFNVKNISSNRQFFKFPPLSKSLYPIALIVLCIVTAVMYTFIDDVQFDTDLTNLSYQEESLKNKEEKFVGINPDHQTKIYFFSEGKDIHAASHPNYSLYEKLKVLKERGEIQDFHSSGDFLIPHSVKEQRMAMWNSYWSKNAANTLEIIDSMATSIGFNKAAFAKFKEWISADISTSRPSIDSSLLADLELNNLINKEKDKVSILTTVVVNKEDKESVKSLLTEIPGVEVFDRADMASSLITLVKDDFNYLLFASAFIVFITLWIIYGRIELTLLTFLPMVISWIWILGFAALLDIKFNFANVVIATFIFGLGDDFSIFVSDGLLARYKYRKNTLSSYKVAITLSALTTIIGTGVLYFAKHPAIHSISLISVLGISLILFISLIVQPIIFNVFVQFRVDNKKAPITLASFIMSVLPFFFFMGGCLITTVILLTLLILPVSKKFKRKVINRALSAFAWWQVYGKLHLVKTKIDKKHLDLNKPAILIANHSSFLDILCLILLSPKVVLVVKKWVYYSPLFGALVRNAGYIYAGDDPEENLLKVEKLIQEGYSVGVFPEGSRSPDGKLKRFHKGAFFLAEKLNLDVIPVMIHGAHEILPKNDFVIKNGRLTVKVFPRIKHDDTSFGTNYSQRTKLISKHFKENYAHFKKESSNAKFCFNLIFQNYVYKGPLLEWYFKIKWRFEAKNYMHYDELVGERKKILDVGCGYGYLSFFLHYRNPEREIKGLDYDDEKINVAKNSFNKNDKVTFESIDITTYKFDKRDVIFFNDVLHYLSEEEQITVINKAAESLEENGFIIVRDGITDMKKRHDLTLKTEKYSTNIIRFNKKSRDFSFFSSSFIQELAKKNNLSYEMVEQSQRTSNVLIILRKQ